MKSRLAEWSAIQKLDSAQLAANRLSDNVGGGKFFLSTLRRALVEERHFALVDGSALPTVGSLRNRFRSGLSPTHASLRSATAIMITTSNSSSQEEEQNAQSITRCSTAHHRDFRAVLRANRTCSTADNPTPGASSSTAALPVSAPLPPWQSCAHAASLSAHTCGAIPAGCVP